MARKQSVPKNRFWHHVKPPKAKRTRKPRRFDNNPSPDKLVVENYDQYQPSNPRRLIDESGLNGMSSSPDGCPSPSFGIPSLAENPSVASRVAAPEKEVVVAPETPKEPSLPSNEDVVQTSSTCNQNGSALVAAAVAVASKPPNESESDENDGSNGKFSADPKSKSPHRSLDDVESKTLPAVIFATGMSDRQQPTSRPHQELEQPVMPFSEDENFDIASQNGSVLDGAGGNGAGADNATHDNSSSMLDGGNSDDGSAHESTTSGDETKSAMESPPGGSSGGSANQKNDSPKHPTTSPSPVKAKADEPSPGAGRSRLARSPSSTLLVPSETGEEQDEGRTSITLEPPREEIVTVPHTDMEIEDGSENHGNEAVEQAAGGGLVDEYQEGAIESSLGGSSCGSPPHPHDNDNDEIPFVADDGADDGHEDTPSFADGGASGGAGDAADDGEEMETQSSSGAEETPAAVEDDGTGDVADDGEDLETQSSSDAKDSAQDDGSDFEEDGDKIRKSRLSLRISTQRINEASTAGDSKRFKCSCGHPGSFETKNGLKKHQRTKTCGGQVMEEDKKAKKDTKATIDPKDPATKVTLTEVVEHCRAKAKNGGIVEDGKVQCPECEKHYKESQSGICKHLRDAHGTLYKWEVGDPTAAKKRGLAASNESQARKKPRQSNERMTNSALTRALQPGKAAVKISFRRLATFLGGTATDKKLCCHICKCVTTAGHIQRHLSENHGVAFSLTRKC
ncbi:expressed unknown protein [Seminavis robusta]|uniref:Uncharacterized protein n=1 Tax=Seminavis robusta TaxID=568900 RepID=A0A9N8D5A8_9STRA|nr:expressed unknown protein [Seminavis robusta]|eukprot:Sro9_g007080.1 n/a (738) ;mRNA; f:42138-44351